MMHKEGSFYVMNGIQRMTMHEKLGIKMSQSKYKEFWPYQCTGGSHISVVFRRLYLSRAKVSLLCFSSILKVSWNQFKTKCFIEEEPKVVAYQGLKDAEPIGYQWPDIYAMNFFGAHLLLGAGIHFKHKIVFSVLDNGNSNQYISSNIIYCGNGINNNVIERANAALIFTAQQGISFRYYIGSKSSHSDKPSNGYKLLGLMYIHNFWIEPNIAKQKRHKNTPPYTHILKVLLKSNQPDAFILKKLENHELMNIELS